MQDLVRVFSVHCKKEAILYKAVVDLVDYINKGYIKSIAYKYSGEPVSFDYIYSDVAKDITANLIGIDLFYTSIKNKGTKVFAAMPYICLGSKDTVSISVSTTNEHQEKKIVSFELTDMNGNFNFED